MQVGIAVAESYREQCLTGAAQGSSPSHSELTGKKLCPAGGLGAGRFRSVNPTARWRLDRSTSKYV